MTAIVDRHSEHNLKSAEDGELDDPDYCDECESCEDETGECDNWPAVEPYRDIDGRSVEGFLPLFETDTLEEMEAMVKYGRRRHIFDVDIAGDVVMVDMSIDQDIVRFLAVGRELQEVFDSGDYLKS